MPELLRPHDIDYVPDGGPYHAIGHIRNKKTDEDFLLSNRPWREINDAFAGLPQVAIRHFIDQAEDDEVVRVLDVGSGAQSAAVGDLRQKYSRLRGGLQFVGVDLVSDLEYDEPEKVLRDIEHLPFADDSFDVAYSRQNLIHISDGKDGKERLRTSLEEINRVLQPEGVLFVDIDIEYDCEQILDTKPDDAQAYSGKLYGRSHRRLKYGSSMGSFTILTKGNSSQLIKTMMRSFGSGVRELET